MSPRASAPDDSGPIAPGSPSSSRSVSADRITVPLSAILGIGLTLALGAGSWFYAGLIQGQREQAAATRDVATEVRSVREGLSAIDRRVGVLEAPGLDARMRELDRRVTTLEAKAGR